LYRQSVHGTNDKLGSRPRHKSKAKHAGGKQS
jgi:hypothetical protein